MARSSISFTVPALENPGAATSSFRIMRASPRLSPARKGTRPAATDKPTSRLTIPHPVGKKITFETGLKTVLQNISSIADISVLRPASGTYLRDPAQSYRLGYKMQVYAGYLSASFRLLNFLNVKAGARLEHTDVSIDFPGTHIPSYNNLVPSLIFSHNFKDEQSLKLAFTRRIERAEYRDINPFMNLSDPYNITTGNPLLKPEIETTSSWATTRPFKTVGTFPWH